MSLIIEDGTGVSGANSYATVAEARAYAALRALSLPVPDADVEVLLVKACDFLETLEDRYQGTRTQSANPLAWPRALVYLFNATSPLADTAIPSILKTAQCQLAFEANSIDLLPTGTGREVIKEKVDVIEREFKPMGSTAITPVLTKALAILEPLFENGGGFTLVTRRI